MFLDYFVKTSLVIIKIPVSLTSPMGSSLDASGIKYPIDDNKVNDVIAKLKFSVTQFFPIVTRIASLWISFVTEKKYIT